MTREPLTRSDKGALAGMFMIPLLGNLHAVTAAVYTLAQGSPMGGDDRQCWMAVIGVYTLAASAVVGFVVFLEHDDNPVFIFSSLAGLALSITPVFSGLGIYRLFGP